MAQFGKVSLRKHATSFKAFENSDLFVWVFVSFANNFTDNNEKMFKTFNLGKRKRENR